MRRKPKPAGYHWSERKAYIHPENGKPSCRWCKGRVDPPRQSWCGNPACLDAWFFRTRNDHFRATIFDRDHGICAVCGLDAHALDVARITGQLYYAERIEVERDPREGWRKWTPRVEVVVVKGVELPRPSEYWRALHARALSWRAANRVPLDQPAWQVDHSVPVADGGDWFCMNNLASMCVPCHRLKTKEENRRRAALRRAGRCVVDRVGVK
jgi:5-methylcytosine-specific restriction enzyme A